jgi:hypothetical protein
MRSSEDGGVHSRQGGSGTCSKQCKGGGAASTTPSMLGVYNHLPCVVCKCEWLDCVSFQLYQNNVFWVTLTC